MTGRVALLWLNRKVCLLHLLFRFVIPNLNLSGGRAEGSVHLRSSCYWIRVGRLVCTFTGRWRRVCFDHRCPTGTDVSNRDEPRWTRVACLAADR